MIRDFVPMCVSDGYASENFARAIKSAGGIT